MILHDITFENLAKAPIKATDVEVVRKIQESIEGEAPVFVDDTPYWTSSNLLMEVKIDSAGEILGTATKKATVKLLGIQDGAKIGDIFQVRLGLYDNDPGVAAFNYISQGYYIVETVDYDYDGGSTTIVMYDHMWKAGKLLYAETIPEDSINYPITVEDLANLISDILSVELMDDFNLLPNATYAISEDLYSAISGTTIKNVIQDISGATGTTARISDHTLVFSQYDPGNENLTSNELRALKIGETYGPVTSVVLGRVPQNDNIAISPTNPSESLIESVNTTDNLLTITDHDMIDGNMIQLTSTIDLPAPLEEGAYYFVYTNGQTDTFALAPTYLDAVDGTNLIDLTTTGSGDITIPDVVVKEIQINNNQILDDEREDLLPALYDNLAGIYWTDVKADTVGLGWHEVGDIVHFTQGTTVARAFLSEIHLTLAGFIKETLVSEVPDVVAINYAAAGGVIKTLYNTEIKVDKQNQEIVSVVSRQDLIEDEFNENLTQINQDVDDVLITIQRAGGGNLLYNSVGFAKETFRDTSDVSYDKLLYWDYPESYDIDTHGRATSYSSSQSQAAGGISGQVVELTGDDMSITQRITVAVGIPLTFALRVNNVIGTGSALITVGNEQDRWQIEIDDLETYNWEEFKELTPVDPMGDPIGDPVDSFQATMPWLDVTIEVTTAQKFVFTDLRLMYGATVQGWVQANGEILSAYVQFTTDGVRVFDSSHDTETRMTFNEFSTRSKTDGTILFEADDQGILTNDLSIKGRTSYMRDGDVIIKQITVGSDNPRSGLAFIRVVED